MKQSTRPLKALLIQIDDRIPFELVSNHLQPFEKKNKL